MRTQSRLLPVLYTLSLPTCDHNMIVSLRWYTLPWTGWKNWLRRRKAWTTALLEKESIFFCFISHRPITSTWTNVVDFCVELRKGSGRTGPYNVELTVVSNNNKKNIFYTRAAVSLCIVIYCMMCTFRVMIRPIFELSPQMTLISSANKRQQADNHLWGHSMTCRSVINTHTQVVWDMPTFYSSFKYKVIYISYGENTTSGVVLIFRVQMSVYVVTPMAHQENIRTYTCVWQQLVCEHFMTL